MKKNPTLTENLVNTDKNSCKKKLTSISSKAESIESIFSSLGSQDCLVSFVVNSKKLSVGSKRNNQLSCLA